MSGKARWSGVPNSSRARALGSPSEAGAVAVAPWFALSPDAVLKQLATGLHGLSSEEAAARLHRFGSNTIGRVTGVSPWRVLIRQFVSPLIYLLLAALGVTLLIGHYTDAMVIAVTIAINVAIAFFQERRAERAMLALQGLVAPTAHVLRDGHRRKVEGAALVPGDIVLLESGAFVPADLRLISASQLQIEEALLTGESVPVGKAVGTLQMSGYLPLGDQHNMAFMGTLVATGRGSGVVVATGPGTQVGAIAGDIRRVARSRTPLQARLDQLGRWITGAVIAISAVVFLIGLASGLTVEEMFLTTVAVAVSAIPEGLPAVMTIALAVAVSRMGKRHAIIRRLAAVETLGSCTVIMSDKTGTLTENRMTVRSIYAGGRRYDVTGSGNSIKGSVVYEEGSADLAGDYPLRMTLMAGMLANESSLRTDNDEFLAHGDPTEIALLVAAAKAGLRAEASLSESPRQAELPFDPGRQFSASVHRGAAGQEIVYIKGAPERVAAMCQAWLSPDGPQPLKRYLVELEVHRMAARGLRVLALAIGRGSEVAQAALEGRPHSLVFLGLQGMIDPPRPEATTAVAACQRAGVRVIMVTGDHARTAVATARQMGIANENSEAHGGAEIAGMQDSDLVKVVRTASVFSRVSPAQKLRIVNALRAAGEVVAVTGDGVNDAPALKAAHLGVAMGMTGTDVAKEASEMVLTDDNFATIEGAIEEGRTAFANIRNATLFLLATSVAELITIIAALASGMPLPYLPAQILWLNLVTSGVQDVALAFEPGEDELYSKPPRPPSEGILNRKLIERLALVAVPMAVGTLSVFVLERHHGAGLGYARVAALTTMVMFQMFFVGNCRSEDLSIFRKRPFSNRVLFIGSAVALAVHIGALHFSPTQAVLRLEPLSLESWIRLTLIALSVNIVVELHKLLRRPKTASIHATEQLRDDPA